MAKGNMAAMGEALGGNDTDTTGGMGTAGSTGVSPDDPSYQSPLSELAKKNNQQQSPLAGLAPQQFTDAAPTWQQQLARVGRALIGTPNSPIGMYAKNVGPEQQTYNPMQENMSNGGDYGRLNDPNSRMRQFGHALANYGRMNTNPGLAGRGPF